MIDAATITGIRDPIMPAFGNINVAGTNVVPADSIASGYWFKLLFGAPTTTGSASTYTHIFTTRATSVPSACIEQQFPDISVIELFNGVKVNSLSMSFGGDGELTMSMDLLGSKETVSATSIVTTATAITLTRFNNFQAVIKEGGATSAICTALDLKFDAGLDPSVYVIGDAGFRSQLPDGIYGISGTLTALFTSSALLAKAIAGTESSLQITLTNGSTSLDIVINELLFKRSSPGIDGPKGVLVKLPFMGYWQNDAGNAGAKITLVNANASY